jgi:hypothetical protein
MFSHRAVVAVTLLVGKDDTAGALGRGRGGARGKKLERSAVSDWGAGGQDGVTINKTADVPEGEYSNKWLHMFQKSSRWIHQS